MPSTRLTARLDHVLRYPDTYTPREMAIIAQREGIEIEIPDKVVGATLAERSADLLRKKHLILSKVYEFRQKTKISR